MEGMVEWNQSALTCTGNDSVLERNYSFAFCNTTNTTCTNEYCVSDEDYVAMIEDHIFPSPFKWVLIFFHFIVFVIGLLGNAAVCVFVYRNHSMRTVTNLFLVNLAVADFMVILLCLPPSVLWDVTNTWFFGEVMCKAVLYLQSVSVSVSILTMTFIAVDRWYAICYPIRFKTTSVRIKSLISIIWMLSLLLVLPEVIFLEIRHHTAVPFGLVYFTDCNFTWTNRDSTIYQMYILVVLYVAPLVLISIMYYQIATTLWSKRMPGSSEVTRRSSSVCRSKQLVRLRTSSHPPVNLNHEIQTRSRRKAAKMLIAIVFMFAICYLPVHVINVLRYTITFPSNDDILSVASLLSHWLCYANSAINPIIYNFMNGQFRNKFKRLFRFLCVRKYFSSTIPSNSRSTKTFSTR